jgi:hypothetical protein
MVLTKVGYGLSALLGAGIIASAPGFSSRRGTAAAMLATALLLSR